MSGSAVGQYFREFRQKQQVVVGRNQNMQQMAKSNVIGFLESEFGYYDKDTESPIVFEQWERELVCLIVDPVTHLKKYGVEIDHPPKQRVIGDIKKNRKTTKSAAIAYAIAWRVPNCEIYVVANDYKQAESRAFNYILYTIENNPHCSDVRAIRNKIRYPNGSVIEAIPMDWQGESGGNQVLVLFDEVHGFIREASEKLKAELTIPAQRPDGFHLFTSYAGFESEAKLWKAVYSTIFDIDDTGNEKLKSDSKRIMVPVQWENKDYSSTNFPLYLDQTGTTLMYWSHGPLKGDPGQQAHTKIYFTDESIVQTKNQFIKLHMNMWVAGTENSVLEDVWIACEKTSIVELPNKQVERYRIPVFVSRDVPLFVGVDGSTVNDHAAVATVYFHPVTGKLAIGPYQIWRPTHEEPLDITNTITVYLKQLHYQSYIHGIYCDPTQLFQTITDLQREGLPIEVFSQTLQNLAPAASDTYTIIQNHNLLIPDDPVIRDYAKNAVANYKSRGWIFNKEKSNRKIDYIVALSFAIHKAIESGYKHLVARKPRPMDEHLLAKMQEQEKQFKEGMDFKTSDLEKPDVNQLDTGRKSQGGFYGGDQLSDWNDFIGA